VDNVGQVVGWSETDNGRTPLAAFLWETGQMLDLNVLAEASRKNTLLEAAAINNAGHIVGYMRTTSKGGSEERAYVLIPTGL
jgi:probable HAF family extracellular repeat protein